MSETEFSTWRLGPFAVDRLRLPKSKETFVHMELKLGLARFDAWMEYNE